MTKPASVMLLPLHTLHAPSEHVLSLWRLLCRALLFSQGHC